LTIFIEKEICLAVTDDELDAGCEVYNLGTGKGTTVLEMVAAFEKVSGKVLTTQVFCSVVLELGFVFLFVDDIMVLDSPKY